jgi:hypothetical protein
MTTMIRNRATCTATCAIACLGITWAFALASAVAINVAIDPQQEATNRVARRQAATFAYRRDMMDRARAAGGW